MFTRTLSKSMRSQAIARSFSANPHRVSEPVMTAPIFRTNVPSTDSFKSPVTASVAYDIKESPLNYQVAVKVPQGLNAGDLTVEIEQGAKAMRITGDAPDVNGTVFSKRFAWGGIMDVDRLQANFVDGMFTLQAPKIHYMNGNSPFNSA